MTDTLVRSFLKSVERSPAAEAVVYKGRRVSYAALLEEVESVAGFLKSRGLEKGARVGILIENSPEYIAVYYGILAAGGVAVGLNAATKARGAVTCLSHSRVSWLIADARHKELPDIVAQMGDRLRLATAFDDRCDQGRFKGVSWNDMKSERRSIDLSLAGDLNSLASIIYTSGTTGDPKGVMLTHRNLTANTNSIVEYLELTGSDSIVNVLPFHYSYGNSVLHTHLAVGGRLVLENSMMYPHLVLKRMVDERVTGFAGVPSTFALLLARTDLSKYDFSAVRYMTQAGGPMPPANVDRFTKELPHVRFFVMYGQTEATARLTYLPPEMLKQKLGSCGIPIPGVTIEIRDGDGKAVAHGVDGEIFASGENIMRGYWENPKGTAKILIDGWLKTGDLARKDEDGYIFINGRSSDIIKSGDHRVAPQEIEEVIAELYQVAEVGVGAAKDEILGQVVKAVIVLKKGASLDVQEVQQYCYKNLAPYKVPREVVFLDELPKTETGKVQRHRL